MKETIKKIKYAAISGELLPRKATAAQTIFPSSEMAGAVFALRKVGYNCNGALAAKLWSRFSQVQCATWITIDSEAIERFVSWIESELDPDEAWS